MAQTRDDTPIDFAIITALKLERQAVCEAFGLKASNRVKRKARVYWRGKLPLPDSESYRIVAAQSPDMANVDAALLTSDTLHHWKPSAALLVGIAASADEKVALGDIVVARHVYYYERGKETPEGKLPEPVMYPADATLFNNAAALPDSAAPRRKRPDGTMTRPKVHHGVTASGERVIADIAARNQIAAGHRKILAIEMEGYGFSKAAWQSFERCRHLVTRAMCDRADPSKNDVWQPYAARVAAAFALNFLLDRPLEPRGPAPMDGPPEVGRLGAEESLRHQLPTDLPDFTGRKDEVDGLLKVLGEGKAGASISGIGGMGGIGKTALAVHVGHLLTAHYRDAQIVVDMQGTAHQPLTPAQAIAQVIHAFDPEAQLPDDEGALGVRYRGVLEGRRALVILDNARDAAQVRPLVGPDCCGLIVTSRRALTLPGLTLLNLDALGEDEALAMLKAIVGDQRATDEELSAIAELCARLPLALRVAGNFLKVHRDWTPRVYAEALAGERERLRRLKQDDLDVEAALGLSAAQLVREDAEPAARWQMLSVFPAPFDRAAAAAVWDVQEDEARDALGELVVRSLLLYDEAEMECQLHDLMRPVARHVFGYMGGERDEAAADRRMEAAALQHAHYYLAAGSAADDLYRHGGEHVLRGLALFDAALPHLRAAWQRMRAREDEAVIQWVSGYPDRTVYVLNLRVSANERISVLKAAQESAHGLGDRRSEGNHLGNLGLAYAALGDVQKAISYYTQALEIDGEIGDRRVEGVHLGNLGNAYRNLGDVQQAISYYTQALEIAREIGRGGADSIPFTDSPVPLPAPAARLFPVKGGTIQGTSRNEQQPVLL